MIQSKSELDLLREQLESAQWDLWAYSKHSGKSSVLDANIQHKRAQVEDLQRRVLALEAEEKEKEACHDVNSAEQTSFG